MAGKLRKHLGVVTITTIAIVVTTIYFKDGTIFQDFANGSFKLPNGIFFRNKQAKPDH
jgi:DNA/RNA endonuclease YhcR with UshA esterase domain